MLMPYTAEINPQGATADAKLEDLVRQLRRQNEQLKRIFEETSKELIEIKKKMEENG